VVSDRYFVNFYGDTAASFLHRNGTDRLWVTWPLTSRRVGGRLKGKVPTLELGNATPLVQLGADEAPRRSEMAEGLSNEQALIEVPADISALERRNAELAFEWRGATRWAFTEAIAAGYLVEEFYRRNRGNQQLGIYLLRQAKGLADFG